MSKMTPSDWAAWVQAIGSILGLGIAIAVPWVLHTREQRAAKKQREGYKNLLRDAFESFRVPIVNLETILLDKENSGPSWYPPDDAAEQLSNAVRTLQNLSVVLNEIHDVKRLDEFEVILPLLDFRRKLDGAKDDFKREAEWLERVGYSPNVVISAVGTLGHHARDMRADVEAILAVLDRQ